MSAKVTATLFAELEEKVAVDLVADIVRGVLDESRQSVKNRAAESAMIAARQRLERLIRAARPADQGNDDPGWDGEDRTIPVGPTGQVAATALPR